MYEGYHPAAPAQQAVALDLRPHWWFFSKHILTGIPLAIILIAPMCLPFALLGTGLLFVAGGFTGQGYVYDLATGADIAVDQFGTPPGSIINDVIVAGGATDFLTKPFDAQEVVLRVRNHLRTRRLHRALVAASGTSPQE